jgi:hypothetical protein
MQAVIEKYTNHFISCDCAEESEVKLAHATVSLPQRLKPNSSFVCSRVVKKSVVGLRDFGEGGLVKMDRIVTGIGWGNKYNDSACRGSVVGVGPRVTVTCVDRTEMAFTLISSWSKARYCWFGRVEANGVRVLWGKLMVMSVVLLDGDDEDRVVTSCKSLYLSESSFSPKMWVTVL